MQYFLSSRVLWRLLFIAYVVVEAFVLPNQQVGTSLNPPDVGLVVDETAKYVCSFDIKGFRSMQTLFRKIRLIYAYLRTETVQPLTSFRKPCHCHRITVSASNFHATGNPTPKSFQDCQ